MGNYLSDWLTIDLTHSRSVSVRVGESLSAQKFKQIPPPNYLHSAGYTPFELLLDRQ
jgi:hypothetical protein